MGKQKKRQPKSLTVADLARMGGKARMAGLTPGERAELGRLAARTRWARTKGKKKVQSGDRTPES